jgi:hypothetical protein
MARISPNLVVCLFLPVAFAQRPAAQSQQRPTNSDEADKLPVKRVVLYKNGVGYFEHLGRVRDNQDITIPFTSGQLNDVLKTLTVLDLDGGRISGVGYGSAAPADRQLGDLRLPFGEKASLAEYLGALRGTRLEVRNGAMPISGRLLSVERKTRTSGGTTLEVDYLSLITDNGEIKTTEVSPSFSVRLLEHGLAGKIDRFLDIVAAGREADVRRMVVSTQGTGERSLFVSYISEVPVWKATYRVVLNSKGNQKPLLQGWAIVDNTTGQDWENAELSLVAGAPQSFIQNLSQPYYSRRPVVALPESANMTPQTYESTLIAGSARLTGTVTDPSGAPVYGVNVKAFDSNGAVAGETRTNSNGTYELESLAEGAVRLEISSLGFRSTVINGVVALAGRANRQDAHLMIGSTTETVEVTAAASTLQTSNADVSARSRAAGSGRALGSGAGLGLSGRSTTGSGSGGGVGSSLSVAAARGQTDSAAQAQELGDLFEYKLKEPISIRKNRSALVPIVQSPIVAEKVSIWNEQARLRRPLRALWLTNSSGLTLDGGSFSVLEEETFAGEGVFDAIRPNEKRLVSYATDLALTASSRIGSEQQRVTRVLVSQGMMKHVSEILEKKTYTFRNEDSSARTVIIEHPVRAGFELRGDVRPSETTAGWMRFRLPVDSKQTASLEVSEVRPVETSYMLTNINDDQVALFLRQKSIDKNVEEALRRIIAQKAVVADLDSKKEDRESQMNKIFDDQQRLRENMKALKGSAEEKALLQRYTQQLNEQETHLEALRKESEQLEAQHDSAQAALDKMIQELSFDVKL